MWSRRILMGSAIVSAFAGWQIFLGLRTSHPRRPPSLVVPASAGFFRLKAERATAPGSPVAGRDWQPMFADGLDGWTLRGGGKARRDADCLLLENDDQRRPGYLVSDVQARDFHARFECRILEGDSGFLFRSRAQPHDFNDVIGPQVQLNRGKGNNLGGIFELQARGWLCRVEPRINDLLIGSSDWLCVEVEVEANRIRVHVDGRQTVDFHDDPKANPYGDAGFFAWQIHGGGRCRVLVRNAFLKLLD